MTTPTRHAWAAALVATGVYRLASELIRPDAWSSIWAAFGVFIIAVGVHAWENT